MSVLPQRTTGGLTNNDGGILRKGARIPGPVAPNGANIGDLWYDTAVKILKVWNGTGWDNIAGGSGGSITSVPGVTIQGTAGRNYFKDTERSAGAGLRVGAAWGKYGVYSEDGDLVLGAVNSRISLQNDILGWIDTNGINTGEAYMGISGAHGSSWAQFSHPSYWNSANHFGYIHNGGTAILSADEIYLRQAQQNRFQVSGGECHTSVRLNVSGGLRVWTGYVYIDGNNALEFTSHGGGWFMQDGTYLRALNNKTIYTAGHIRGDNGMTALGLGIYYKGEGDNTHRTYWNSSFDGVHTLSWSYVMMEAVAHDHATRCEAQTRHVNRANSVWRWSDAQGHTNFSDPRFKQNIKKVPMGKNKVKEIEPIEFQWDEKHDHRDPGRKNFGFDASTLPPEVTLKSYLLNEETGEEEECLMMDPVGVTAMLWTAFLEVIDQCDELEARLDALENTTPDIPF